MGRSVTAKKKIFALKVVQELHFDNCLFGNQRAVYRVLEIRHTWRMTSTKRSSPQDLNHAVYGL